jgi:Gpi18-like mannosyltransferase
VTAVTAAPAPGPRAAGDAARGAASSGGHLPGRRLATAADAALLAVALLLALALRILLVPFVSEDFTYFFGAWSAHIRAHGGLRALGTEFTNYQPLYLYLLALTNALPVSTLWSVKLIPIAADFVLAYLGYLTVRLRYPGGTAAAAAGLAILYAPTVVLNGSAWGQCDVLFTTCLLASLYSLMRGRPWLACLGYGLAFSFKLQSVFFAPVLLVAWLKGSLRFKHLLLIPAVYVVTLHPALYLGRSLTSMLGIYGGQPTTYRALQMGAPNIYQWVSNDHYAVLMPVGIALAGAVVAALVLYLWRRGARRLDAELLVSVSLAFAAVMPLLLPGMHERYFFVADVFSLVYAFYFPRRFAVAVITVSSSLLAYVPYLYQYWPPLPWVSLALLVSTAAVIGWLLYDARRTPPLDDVTATAGQAPGR